VDPVIVPPQNAAPLDSGGLFKREWYLFFTAARAASSSGNGIVQRGTSSARKLLDTQGLPDGALWAESDTGLVYQWHGAALAWLFIAGTQIIDLTLPHGASTTINAPTTGAVELVVILRQDGTGGGTVVWGTSMTATAASIDTTASTVSAFRFVLAGGKYVQVGQPTTGMTP
jgi:hypothetical protein